MHNTYFMPNFISYFFISIVVFISACTVQMPQPEEPVPLSSQPEKGLCVYRNIKGIAELIEIKADTYVFKFYPGDDIFEVKKDSIITSNNIDIAYEFKAVKIENINTKPNIDCPLLEFELIEK